MKMINDFVGTSPHCCCMRTRLAPVGQIKLGGTQSIDYVEKYVSIAIFTDGTEYAGWINSAYVIQDISTGEYVGFFDLYNFDYSGRSLEGQIKTFVVGLASWTTPYSCSFPIYYWKP